MPLPTNLWSLLGNGTGIGGGDSGATAQDLQQVLGFAKQYDPNASIGWTPEGNQYVNFNNALLPQNATGGRGIENLARMPGSGERLGNPNLVWNDPTFGQVTTPFNLQEKGPSLVDIIGPLIVGGAATLGAGGGLGLIGNLMNKAPQALSSFSNMFSSNAAPNFPPQLLALLALLSGRGNGNGG